MLSLVDAAVDDHEEETKIRLHAPTLGRAVRTNLPVVGRSPRVPGGQDTPPRNAAQFNEEYEWEARHDV